MPAFVAALLGGLLSITSSLVGRVLVALGIGTVTYTGIVTVLDYAKAQALASIGSAPAQLVQLLGFLGVGELISIITSALLARLILNGLNSGALKRFVLQ